jgi:hypothetical protein
MVDGQAMSRADAPSLMGKPSWRRYMTRFFSAIVAYLAVLLPVGYAAHHGLLPGRPWLYPIVLAPAIPVGFVILAMLRYLDDEEDEYQRVLNVRAFVAATGLTLTVCTAWGLLQSLAGLPQVSLMHVFTVFCLCQGVANVWIRLRSR